MWSEILEIVKYTVPALAVGFTVYFVLKTFLDNRYKAKYLELSMENARQVLPVRLQAYERLALFLERISPNSMIHRVSQPGMSASDLRSALTANIRQEFEHNFSQQIYVTPATWNVVITVKEELVSVINRASASLPEAAPATDLSRAIVHYYMESNKVPMQEALDKIKLEVKKLF